MFELYAAIFSARAISRPATTPAIPSKRPPSGAVSECDPTAMAPPPTTGAPANKVSGGVDPRLKPRCAHRRLYVGATLERARGEGAARPRALAVG